MSDMPCSECGKPVAPTASACNHCGCPVITRSRWSHRLKISLRTHVLELSVHIALLCVLSVGALTAWDTLKAAEFGLELGKMDVELQQEAIAKGDVALLTTERRGAAPTSQSPRISYVSPDTAREALELGAKCWGAADVRRDRVVEAFYPYVELFGETAASMRYFAETTRLEMVGYMMGRRLDYLFSDSTDVTNMAGVARNYRVTKMHKKAKLKAYLVTIALAEQGMDVDFERVEPNRFIESNRVIDRDGETAQCPFIRTRYTTLPFVGNQVDPSKSLELAQAWNNDHANLEKVARACLALTGLLGAIILISVALLMLRVRKTYIETRQTTKSRG